MATWGGELFDIMANSSPAFTHTGPVITFNKFDNSWSDPYARVDLTEYVIQNVPGIGDYVGAYQIYESQLF